MILLSMIATLMAQAAPVTDFTVTVSIMREGDEPKGGAIEFAKGVCTLKNGPKARKADTKVCREIGERIRKDESTYTSLPWINSPHVPSFVVVYKSGKESWTRETGVMHEKESKPREALRELAVKVLETAK